MLERGVASLPLISESCLLHGRLEMHTLIKVVWFLVALLGARSIAEGAPPALFEVSAGKQTYRGREMVRDTETVWFLERDGSLEKLKANDITNLPQVGP